MTWRAERGFTLVELLVVMAISVALMAIAIGAIRHYWLVRSLEGGTEEIVSEMRAAHARTMAESHPLVYGVRFTVGESRWDLVRFDPRAAPGDQCTIAGTNDFDADVYVSSGSFESSTSYDSDATDVCSAAFPGSVFALFFARGTATAGEVVLRHDGIDRSEDIDVLGLTGRVQRS
ncbi:MAG: pilus assembly FimT family protein [Actinomycetota bacterium]